MTAVPLVVGAGAAGLGAATALARRGHAPILIDRVPVTGGIVRYDREEVRRATRDAEQAGVIFELGMTAIRWRERRLLVCGPGEIRWYEGAVLVNAAGVRPPTAAELSLTGSRPAGVLSVSVAKHLLEADQKLWQNVVILGDGPGAAEADALIRHAGGAVTYVGENSAPPRWATSARLGWCAVSVRGRDRVTGVDIRRSDEIDSLKCDALLLAGPPVAVRNIEVRDDESRVLCLQSFRVERFDETVQAAAASVESLALGTPSEMVA